MLLPDPEDPLALRRSQDCEFPQMKHQLPRPGDGDLVSSV
tara:strand:- start:41902 stop:42021 length:120 start_codon:yes stop_codon:yes gene_type:complete